MKTQTRETWIDITRLLSMIGIIMLHCPLYEKEIQSFLSTFCVAVFFIVSGYLYHPTTLKSEISKSIKSLLIPYIILGMINCIYWSTLDLHTNKNPFLPNLIEYIQILCTTKIGLPLIGPLWFLIVLFIIRIAMVKITHYNYIYSISLLNILIAYIIYTLLPNTLFYAPLNIFLSLPFFSIGYIMQHNKQYIDNILQAPIRKKLLAIIILLTLSIFTFKYQGGNNMSMHNFGNNIITFYLCGVVCSVCMIILSSLVVIKSSTISHMLHIANNGLPLMIGLQIILIDFIKRVIQIYAYHLLGAITLSTIIIIITYPLTILAIRFFPYIIGERK